ncbi:CgeB family protein [Paenibacillus humicola]|uniref:CgeB family protein n=1 Tax=Paenibacillus humicola TaxID=3110540 RepID=UPI00237A6181|nr:glycosyltransferase [Paenibacillus humicola]
MTASGRGSILMCYGKTPYTPGRFLEDALRRIGLHVDVIEDLANFSYIDTNRYCAVLFVESPSRPKVRVKNIHLVKIPKLFWIHHGENRLAANQEMCSWYKPDLMLMSHSLHLASHFPVPVRFFPFGVDPHIYYSTKPYRDRKVDVAFVGGKSSMYRQREISLRLIETLFGGDKTLSLRSSCFLHQLGQLYGDSKIVFNQTADRIKSFNMRIFEGMGCGALLLTDHTPEQAKLFKDGVHLVVYSSMEDLYEKLDYYLYHPDEAQKIARSGQSYVLASQTYDQRALQLLKWVRKL